MATPQAPFFLAALLLACLGLHWSSPLPACPQSCTCQSPRLLNCSSGLSSVPQPLQDSFNELDLSHNLLSSVKLQRPHRRLRKLWLGNNSIAHLSLCLDSKVQRGNFRHRSRTRSRRGCRLWAPTLQLLSVERNLLGQLPEGLDGVRSLQVLQLSFNRISTLQPGELSHLQQLKELHLKQNLITHLHPRMFQSLVQLRVLDLSFNKMTSLHPSVYVTLRNIGTDFRLNGNGWQCDCNMRSVRRRMIYDHSRGLQTWSVMCASPSILYGRDLLLLEEEDLKCLSAEKSPDLHQDVTVYSGSEILLSCSAEDSLWWTPNGQATVSQRTTDLLISDISERNTGLYVCVSEEQHIASVFNLQISKVESERKERSLPRARRQIAPQDTARRVYEEKKLKTTSSDLALAVCLSIFFTFLIAFILGVLARPCIDVLWKRVTRKKTPSTTSSVTSHEQRQYDNEAFSDAEEPEEVVPHRERRVTFSSVDIIENSNIHYYDTVGSGEQDSNRNGSRQSTPEDEQSDDSDRGRAARHTKDMEFERIPDPAELEERRLSSSSESSLSEKDDQMAKGHQFVPRFQKLAEISLQQSSDSSAPGNVELQHISIEGKSEILEFSSEPFTDWSPHTNNRNPTGINTSPDNGELFEFSDSSQNISPRPGSVISPFDSPKQIRAPTSDKQKRGDSSSSSSYISDNEPTEYTVNSDQDTEQSEGFGLQLQNVDPVKPTVTYNQGDYTYNSQTPPVRPDYSFSSDSSDSDKEPKQSKSKQKRLSSRMVKAERNDREEDKITPWPSIDLANIAPIKRRLDFKAPTPASDSSSCSAAEDELYESRLPIKVSQAVSHDLKNQWPAVGHKTRVKRRLDIKAPSLTSGSSSTSQSEEEMEDQTRFQRPGKLDTGQHKRENKDPTGRWPVVDLHHISHIKRRLDIKAPSPSSDSSSSSENETTGYMKKQEHKLHMSQVPAEVSQTKYRDPENQWPVVDLWQTIRIKRRLDIKAPRPTSDSSSSSDSENERIGFIDHQKPGKLVIERFPSQEPKTGNKDPNGRWPVVDLHHIPHIKRGLDIKAPSQSSDSSSSSESEVETGYMKKQEQNKLHMSQVPVKVSQPISRDSKNQWPVVDLWQTIRIKRRLDIKAPSPGSDSSSSSDSEDETTGFIDHQQPGKLVIERFPSQEPKTGNKDPTGTWPVVDLHHIPHIKRRLDIKAPSPSSDSSSSSENETTGYTKKQEQNKLHMSQVPVEVSQPISRDPENQWPVVDLWQTIRIKRRLDVKAPRPTSDSSSSSDSEDETTGYIDHQKPGKLVIERFPSQEPKRENQDPNGRWPVVDLHHIPHIKRRLDIKAPSQSSDSSSSSDSEVETGYMKKQEQNKLHMSQVPVKVSQPISRDPENQWPVVDLWQTMRIKRRLDIKAPRPTSDSSSSSESEDETTGYIDHQQPGKLVIERFPSQEPKRENKDPNGRWPVVDLHHIPHIKRRLDIKAPSPGSDTSSSSDSEDETTGFIDHQQPGKLVIERFPSQEPKTDKYSSEKWPVVDLYHIPHIKRRLDIKAPSQSSDSSSSSDSEDETTGYTKKQEQNKLHMSQGPVEVSQPISRDPENQWPVVDLWQTIRIKRRLDIKAPRPTSDSSSGSDSENETTGFIDHQQPGKLVIERFPSQEPKRENKDPNGRWPVVDLHHIRHIKRRLDIKAPSPGSDSSSSSENETTGYTKKQEQNKLHVSQVPVKVSQTKYRDPENQWPVIDLWQTIRIKRRLDIKAPSPGSDSSSSSDSEDETTGFIDHQQPGKLVIERFPSQEPKTDKYSSEKWPVVDLYHIPHIKRRLDIKAPSQSSDSSSSSDSEDETTGYMKKQEQNKLHVSQVPVKVSQPISRDPENQWPVIDLWQTIRIKRRLDIKAPSPGSDSSSSSESEDETTGYTKKQEQNKLHMSQVPVEVSQPISRDSTNQWPAVDLWQTIQIKRRLDIKAPRPTSDSSSSSESENETTGYIDHQQPGKLVIERFPSQEPKTDKYSSEKWPVVDLYHIPHIKRRLDIKAPSPGSDSSSSSDSEDGLSTHFQQTQKEQFYTSGSQIKVSQTKINGTENQWPAVSLGNVTKVKRRLDIKMSTQPWDSVLSGRNTNNVFDEKNEKAYKSTHSYTSSSSDGKEEGLKDRSNHHLTSELILNSRPELGPNSNLKLKRRLNIEARSPSSKSSSSSDESDRRTTDITETVRSDKVHLGMIPNKKVPSQHSNVGLSKQHLGSRQSESYSSTSEGENQDHEEKVVSEKKFITSSRAPLINVSHSPQKDSNIKLEKYEMISDDLGNKPSDDPTFTTEINPELQSRWATMNLGISRFRKRLEITSRTNETTEMQQPPTSDSSTHSPSAESRSEKITRLRRRVDGIRHIIHTESSPVPENKPVNVSPTFGNPDDKSRTSTEFIQRESEKYSVPTNEGKQKLDTVLVDFGAPKVSRYLDITEEVPSKQSHQLAHSSSSSSTEDEMINHYVLDLSLGVPQLKRRLNIKAPSPEPSSSSSSRSEDENDVVGYEAKQSTHASNISAVADDSPILYKRSIIKASSISSYSFSPSGWRSKTVDVTKQKVSGDRNASLSSIGFDDIVRRRAKQPSSDTDVDLPHEIKWTGVGHHLPDLPISQTTSSDTLIPVQQSVSAPLYPSGNLSVKMMQDNEKPVTLSHENSSFAPKGAPPSTNDNLDRPGSLPGRTYETSWVVSEDRRERRGLNALKAKSLEMRKWDRDLDMNASPSFDEHDPQGVAHVGFSTHPADTQVLSEQPSPKPHEKRILDLLYGVPRYRRHDIKLTEPQEAPPPGLGTPPPDY